MDAQTIVDNRFALEGRFLPDLGRFFGLGPNVSGVLRSYMCQPIAELLER